MSGAFYGMPAATPRVPLPSLYPVTPRVPQPSDTLFETGLRHGIAYFILLDSTIINVIIITQNSPRLQGPAADDAQP